MSKAKLNTSRQTASSPFPERARRMSATAIILLALWSGGFGCLWCCASDLPEGCCDKRSAAMSHHATPACSAHRRCCESTESNQYAAIQHSSQPAAAHCCPIGSHSNGPAAFPSPLYFQGQALTSAQWPAPVSYTVGAPPLVFEAPPANKGSTYLRCCVLLI
ncbi:MAG: hypothetical protein ACJ74J_11500 [Blastocatellia bacterium]